MSNEMWAAVVGALIGVVVPVFFAFLPNWGAFKHRMLALESRAKRVEAANEELRHKLEELSEVYVTYKHFNEIMSMIKETQRELREDVKKVLDILCDKN